MSNKIKGTLLSLTAGTLWGSMGLFVTYFSGLGLVSMELVTLRVWLGAVLLAVTLFIKDKSLFQIHLKDAWIFLGTGIVSIVTFSYFYFYTIRSSSMAQAAVLLYLAPAIVMLLSAVFFKEKITLRKLTAVVIAFIGCMLVTGWLGSSVSMKPTVLLTGLASAIGYALYSIFSRAALSRGYRSLTITLYTFIFAAVACLCLSNPKTTVTALFVGTTPVIVWILMGVVTAVLPYIFYTLSLSYIEGSRASVVASVEPVVAALLGLCIGQAMDIWSVLGILLVLGAVVLLNLPQKN